MYDVGIPPLNPLSHTLPLHNNNTERGLRMQAVPKPRGGDESEAHVVSCMRPGQETSKGETRGRLRQSPHHKRGGP